MNKFVITVQYQDGWECCGPTYHYAVFGGTAEAVFVDFFSNLEKEMKQRTKNVIALAKEMKRIDKFQQSENHLSLVYEAKMKYSDNDRFTFQDLEFDVCDFLIFKEDKYNIDYDMVSVKSLDDWFTEHLIKDK